MTEFKRIYLQPECCANPDVGRLWCQDDAPQSCPDGETWTQYVLASEHEDLQAKVKELEVQALSGGALCSMAARIIQEDANSLKDCHTVNGEWRGDVTVKSEYEYLTAFCKRLTDYAQQLRGDGE